MIPVSSKLEQKPKACDLIYETGREVTREAGFREAGVAAQPGWEGSLLWLYSG